MNVLAKIIAIPVKLVNLICKLLLLLAPITRFAGIVLYVIIFLILGEQYLLPLIMGMEKEANWVLIFKLLAIPTIVTFAELPFLIISTLTDNLYKWLWEKNHSSAKKQINDYICHKRYNDMKATDTSESMDEDIQELARKLKDIHDLNGG